MHHLLKFQALSLSDKRLLCKVTLLLALIRLGLAVCPPHRLHHALCWAARPRRPSRACDAACEARIVWASAAAGRLLLGDRRCLTQALGLQFLLMRRAHPTTVHIGVARGAGRQLEAHAWVEDDGRILIGGNADSLQGYTRLAAFPVDCI